MRWAAGISPCAQACCIVELDVAHHYLINRWIWTTSARPVRVTEQSNARAVWRTLVHGRKLSHARTSSLLILSSVSALAAMSSMTRLCTAADFSLAAWAAE